MNTPRKEVTFRDISPDRAIFDEPSTVFDHTYTSLTSEQEPNQAETSYELVGLMVASMGLFLVVGVLIARVYLRT